MITRIDTLKELPDMDIAFWIYSKSEKTFEYISPRFKKIVELDIEKITDSKTFRQVVHPDDQTKVIRNLNGGYSDAAHEIEYRILTPKGKVKWLKNISICFKNDQEKPGTVIGCTFLKSKVKDKNPLLQLDTRGKAILRMCPDSFILVDKTGKILYDNLRKQDRFMTRHAPSNLTGKTVLNALINPIGRKTKDHLGLCNSGKGPLSFEVELSGPQKTEWYEIRLVKIRESLILATFRNVTSLLSRINKVERFYNITEQSQELVMITDVDGAIEYINPKFTSVSGYSHDELMGQNASILKSGKHPASFYSELWTHILKGNAFKAEFYNLKKSGGYFIEEKIITPFTNISGEITHFISTGRDVTLERRNEEKAKKFRQLEVTMHEKEQKTRTLSLINSNENERKKLAKEIHEGLSQMLSAAMANLDSLMAKNVISTNEKNKIEFVNQMVSEIIHELRGISTHLSPINLYEFGLFPVIEQMVKKTHAGFDNLKLQFSSNIAGKRFKSEIEINIYRIIQEAIQNVIKHSNARKINLVLNHNSGTLTLLIKDDGQGINMNTLEFKKINNFGILNIEARAKSIGGILTITSKKDKGFLIELSIHAKTINL